MNKKINYLCVPIILLFISSCRDSTNSLYEISVKEKVIFVELAYTPQLRRRGLQHRDSLEEDKGMLFIFPQSKYVEFWMKDTKVPLDIAYINENGMIVQIERMRPYSTTPVTSTDKVKYALEVRAGFFNKFQIYVGDKVYISDKIKEVTVY